MACHLFDAKPLTEPMLAYCQLSFQWKFIWNSKAFIKKIIWNCHLQNVHHFVSASMCNTTVNTLRPEQNDHHLVNDIKLIFVCENCCTLIHISLKFVSDDPINNKPALVWIMVCHRTGSIWTNQWHIACASLGLNNKAKNSAAVRVEGRIIAKWSSSIVMMLLEFTIQCCKWQVPINEDKGAFVSELPARNLCAIQNSHQRNHSSLPSLSTRGSISIVMLWKPVGFALGQNLDWDYALQM